MFDITVGLYASGGIVTGSPGYSVDSAGKLIFAGNTLMMREKVQIYNQMAQALLGDSSAQFTSPFTGATTNDYIDAALFLPFKRLFARDKIKPETFAMKVFSTAAFDGSQLATTFEQSVRNARVGPNLEAPIAFNPIIITDAGATANPEYTFGGTVGNLVNASNTAEKVGLLFYDYGVAVLDIEKVFWGNQHMSGVISAVTSAATPLAAGTTLIGANPSWYTAAGASVVGNASASFVPDFMVSGSIDDIVNHIASVRFGSGSDTTVTFQNVTTINSTLVFCEAAADEFNYSSNPTFTDDDGRIVVIDSGAEDTQKSFTFITTIGLYDAADNLLAVAKLSRPVEKNDEKKLTFRVRLDY
jgi:hypothetical protein